MFIKVTTLAGEEVIFNMANAVRIARHPDHPDTHVVLTDAAGQDSAVDASFDEFWEVLGGGGDDDEDFGFEE